MGVRGIERTLLGEKHLVEHNRKVSNIKLHLAALPILPVHSRASIVTGQQFP